MTEAHKTRHCGLLAKGLIHAFFFLSLFGVFCLFVVVVGGGGVVVVVVVFLFFVVVVFVGFCFVCV